MANPTTYFGWVMPTSTDLVTDLPADFNVFGQGVDTSMQYLLGGTTGQVLSKTSGTNMAFTWVTPTDQTPLTTKGDLFGFSTLDARIPIGTNNQVLTADSAQALGLKWATPSSGALTKITSTTWTAATSVNINSCFSATYARYLILIKNFAASGQDITYMKLRVSGTDASSDYYFGFEKVAWTGGTSTVSGSAVTTGFYCGTGVGVRTLTSIDIGNPFETTGTSYNCLGISDNSGITGAGFHTPSTSYDGFSLIWASGTFTGEVVIYGYSN